MTTLGFSSEKSPNCAFLFVNHPFVLFKSSTFSCMKRALPALENEPKSTKPPQKKLKTESKFKDDEEVKQTDSKQDKMNVDSAHDPILAVKELHPYLKRNIKFAFTVVHVEMKSFGGHNIKQLTELVVVDGEKNFIKIAAWGKQADVFSKLEPLQSYLITNFMVKSVQQRFQDYCVVSIVCINETTVKTLMKQEVVAFELPQEPVWNFVSISTLENVANLCKVDIRGVVISFEEVQSFIGFDGKEKLLKKFKMMDMTGVIEVSLRGAQSQLKIEAGDFILLSHGTRTGGALYHINNVGFIQHDLDNKQTLDIRKWFDELNDKSIIQLKVQEFEATYLANGVTSLWNLQQAIDAFRVTGSCDQAVFWIQGRIESIDTYHMFYTAGAEIKYKTPLTIVDNDESKVEVIAFESVSKVLFEESAAKMLEFQQNQGAKFANKMRGLIKNGRSFHFKVQMKFNSYNEQSKVDLVALEVKKMEVTALVVEEDKNLIESFRKSCSVPVNVVAKEEEEEKKEQ